jgi:hypothetical protein
MNPERLEQFEQLYNASLERAPKERGKVPCERAKAIQNFAEKWNLCSPMRKRLKHS